MKYLSVLMLFGLVIGCNSNKTETASHDHGGTTHNHEVKNEDHKHAADCGHEMVQHDNHKDYKHDGEYHHVQKDGTVAVHGSDADNTRKIAAADHPHNHNENCGHEKVVHGDHVDYVHDGEYHHQHNDHVDQHGDRADM
jgi:hypothetical protein